MVKRRLAGLAFFVAVAGFVGFTTAQYARAFDESIRVRLVLDDVGNALPLIADVKVRGVLVGDDELRAALNLPEGNYRLTPG